MSVLALSNLPGFISHPIILYGLQEYVEVCLEGEGAGGGGGRGESKGHFLATMTASMLMKIHRDPARQL